MSGLLCRVFLSGPNPEVRRKLGGLENSEGNHFHPRSSSLLIQEPGSTSGQGSMSESQVYQAWITFFSTCVVNVFMLRYSLIGLLLSDIVFLAAYFCIFGFSLEFQLLAFSLRLQ